MDLAVLELDSIVTVWFNVLQTSQAVLTWASGSVQSVQWTSPLPHIQCFWGFVLAWLQGGTACWCLGTLGVLPKHIFLWKNPPCVLGAMWGTGHPTACGDDQEICFRSESWSEVEHQLPLQCLSQSSVLSLYLKAVFASLCSTNTSMKQDFSNQTNIHFKSIKPWKEEANCSANVARAVQCQQPQLPWLPLAWNRWSPCYFKDFCQAFQLRESKTETHQLYLEG